MEKTLKEQAKIVEQRLYYHFGNSNGGFNVPEQLPFMKEFFAEIVMLVAMAKSSDELGDCNMPRVTVSLPLSNEQILKGIQTSPRYQLPKEWLKNEHTNSNYMGGFLNAVKWMEGNAR